MATIAKTYTQANRPLKFSCPELEGELGADALMLVAFSGEETISAQFRYVVELVSMHQAVDETKVLRKPVSIAIQRGDKGNRYIHGIVNRFVRLGRREELTAYAAEVVPWTWFLGLSRDCRIYSKLAVPDILEQVFNLPPYAAFQINCKLAHPKRPRCVQYRESHLNFVSRLMEEEGIYYIFQHTESEHLLKVTDGSSAIEPCLTSPVYVRSNATAAYPYVMWNVRQEHNVGPDVIVLRDYAEEQPSRNLLCTAKPDQLFRTPKNEEVFDYFAHNYRTFEDGELYAGVELEAQRSLRSVIRGESSCPEFEAGYMFSTTESSLASDQLLVSVRHTGRAGDFAAWDTGEFQYKNEFVAVPKPVRFYPPLQTPRPRVHGSQTALVVGPKGSEINVDKFGRVQVRFFWERQTGHEMDTDWVRVATTSAGKGWGAIHPPRVGEEVIVDFLEGDPDRPIVTGRVYNGERPHPYELPANKTQSGFKSRSTLEGTADNFNEIRMEDKKGSELLYIHAEKDKKVMVENNRTESVGANETITIGANRTESVGKNEKISIADNRTEDVGKDEAIDVGKNQTLSVGKDQSISVGNNQTISVSKDRTLDVAANRTTTVGKDDSLTVADDRKTDVGKDDTLQVGKKLTIVVADQITLKTGDASITMKKDGTITIEGKDIKLTGSGKITAKADSDVVLKGSKVSAN
jgi:type VI secretion system secreted protein VgrG